MSLAGKISITKTMLTSQLVFCMTNLPPPPEKMWKEIEQMIYGFLSNNKSEKMKRNTLIGPNDRHQIPAHSHEHQLDGETN